jgi:hypothetical protein
MLLPEMFRTRGKLIFVLLLFAFAGSAYWVLMVPPGLGRWMPASRQSCFGNLRNISVAKIIWYQDHPENSNSIPTFADLGYQMAKDNDSVERTFQPRLPRCPDGGEYSIEGINKNPRCSMPGHSLDFSQVIVLSKSGKPLPNVRLHLRMRNANENVDREVLSDTDGKARLSVFPAVESELWTTGTVTAASAHATQTVALPKTWPLRLVLDEP